MRRAILLFFALVAPVCADIAVITHKNNKLVSLTTEEVQNIFMGRTRAFSNGNFALPIDQSSPLRATFYQSLTGRPVEQVNAYWARIIFTGQASPPLQVPDDEAVLKTVRANEGAIGYIDKAHTDKSVNVLVVLPDASTH